MSTTILNKPLTTKVIYSLFFLMVIASAIRFYNLTYVSLWLDEIYSMTGADPNTTLAEVYEYSKRDQPPLFFILLNGWLKLFGYTDFAGRALTCVYGVLGVLAIFLIGKEIKDERLGLFAAFITTVNWFHTDISKELRFYPLIFLLSILSYLFYLRAVKKLKPVDFLLYIISTAMLLNTHYFGMVVFVSQFFIFILILIFFKRSLILIFGGLTSGVVVALSFWHWLPIIQEDLQINQFHVGPVTFDLLFNLAWDYAKEPVTFVIYIICVGIGTRKLYLAIKNKKFVLEHLIVLGWIFFGFMIPLIYSLVKVPLLTGKYLTIIVPAIFLVIANGFADIQNRKIVIAFVSAISISSFIILFIARPPYKPRHAEDWREVAMYFADRHLDNELIFSQHAWFDQYYFKKFSLRLPQDPKSVDVASLVKNNNQIWLLVRNKYTEGLPANGFLPDQEQIIRNEFELQDSVCFKHTKVLGYGRKYDSLD